MAPFGVQKGEILSITTAAKSESIDGEEIDEENIADEVIRATIKHSKEVLTRQRDLIGQVFLTLYTFQPFPFSCSFIFDVHFALVRYL